MKESIFFDYVSKFITLTAIERQILKPHLTYRKYTKNQYIVQQNDHCTYDSFLIKGCVKTFHVDDEGQEHVIRFAIENWWAADMGSFMNQIPAIYNVQCIEDTEVIQFSYETLLELFTKIPSFERFFRIIIQNAFIASEKRIVRNFSLSAKDRYLNFIELYPQLEQRIPQYVIASYLGITKQYLSEIRNAITQKAK